MSKTSLSPSLLVWVVLLIHTARSDLFSSHLVTPSSYKIPQQGMLELSSHYEQDGGMILTRQSEKYEAYSTPWNKKCTNRPQVIFVPGSYENARLAFLLILKYDEPYTIMNGGHDLECGSTTTHTVINLSLLNKVRPDYEKQQIRTQAGAKWKDLYDAVKDSGFEVMGGLSPTVGVTGFVTGAGFNWKLGAFYGCGGQNAVEALVILANGDIIRTTRDNDYNDLMWGVFGAGGRNFAFILEVTLKLHPYLEKKYNFFGVLYQVEHFYNLKEMSLTWLKAFQTQHPEQGYGSSTVMIMPQASSGYLVTIESVCKLQCNFKTEYSEILARYPPSSYIFEDTKLSFYDYEMNYVAQEAGVYPQPVYSNGMSAFMKEMDRSQFDKLLQTLHTQEVIGGSLQITHFLRSVVKPQLTSFPFPSAVWKIADGFVWTDPAYETIANEKARRWNKLLQETIPHKYLGSYINYIDYNLDDYEKNYFGGHLEELVGLKQKYDPLNKFNRKWGVPLLIN